jgi:hypothetical protein
MAAAERIERGYLGSLLRLTLLAPDIVEAILDGRAPDDVTLPGCCNRFRWVGMGSEGYFAFEPLFRGPCCWLTAADSERATTSSRRSMPVSSA